MELALDTPMRRRSRMRRQSTGKRLELTPRDLEIFKLLRRYRYLRSNVIHAFLGGNKTKLIERLGDLYHEGGYLDRPVQQWQAANARYMPIVYENAERAEETLLAHGLLEDDVRTWLARGQRGAHRQFAHALLICEALASLELSAAKEATLRFIPWPEILAKAPEATRTAKAPFALPVPTTCGLPGAKNGSLSEIRLIPDALFGLEYLDGAKKSYRFFALEVDRATMPVSRKDPGQSSYLKKLAAYRELIVREVHRTYLGVPNLLVLTVTANEQHMRTIMRAVDQLMDDNGSKLFLFKPAPSRALRTSAEPMFDLLETLWARVGNQAFDIGRA